jgi:hypothetical protein
VYLGQIQAAQETQMKSAKANEKQYKSPGRNKSSLRIREPKPGLLNISLSEIAAKARKLAPKKDWDKVPTDLAANIDKYLYSPSPQDKV